jgi:hypothetical protein
MATEKKRQSRNNHSVAEQFAITDGASAQRFCDEAIAATKNEKPTTMFNGSGFVSPQILDGHDVDNLLRMASSIINNIALRIGTSDDSDEATKALSVISSYATGAASIQQNARNERILRQAEEIRKAQTASK